MRTYNLEPHVALLNSAHNKVQFFYLILWNLPDDTLNFPPPAFTFEPSEDGLSIEGVYPFTVPETFTGNVITYPLLFPYTNLGDGVPVFDQVVIKTGADGATSKTGSVDKQKVTSLPEEGFLNYQCRPFVLELQDDKTSKYFVGALVDLPAGSDGLSTAANSGNPKALTVAFQGTSDSSSVTFCTVPIASAKDEFEQIWMDGHETSGLIGIIMNASGIDLYIDGPGHIGINEALAVQV